MRKLVCLVVLSLAGATASDLPQMSSPGDVDVGEGQNEEYDADACEYDSPDVCTVATGTESNKISIREGHCMSCSFMTGAQCTQDTNLQDTNFLDLTDFASQIACGGTPGTWNNWHKVLKSYAWSSVEDKGHSLTLEIAHEGARQQWEDKPGTFMIINATGRQKGFSVDCVMEAAIQVYICNDRDSAGLCTCTDSQGNPQLMQLTQGANLTQPASDPKTYCGKWFVGVSSAIQMLINNMRAVLLEMNLVLSSCTSQDVNTGWVAHGNQHVGSYPSEFIWWPQGHGCSIAHGQCYWSSLETAQQECAAWPACKALYCSTQHNGGAFACYARGGTTLTESWYDTSFIKAPSRELGAARVALFASREEAMDVFRI